MTPATEQDDWRTLYRIGASAAIAVLVLVPFQMFVFIRWPPPETVADWFALYRSNALVGLLDMDLLLLVDQALICVLCVALYVVLRRTSPSLMALALAFAVVATSSYIASNPALEMLRLSRQYDVAMTPAQHLQALGAAEAMVARWIGSSFTASYVLGAISFLITAGVMLRGRVFSRTTGYVGVVFGVLSLVPASAGRVGLVFSLLSLLPMWLWFALSARRLLQLGRDASPATSDISAKPTAM